MGNALTVYQKMPDPLAAIQTLGRDIAGSKMFGDLTISQGNVFAMECLSRGIPPLMLAEEYDVIFGKLSRKASASMSNFLKAGGTSKILSRTADCASVELTLNGDKQVFTLTWEAAQQETFPYEGKEKDIIKAITAWKAGTRGAKQPELKPKYATPHSRMQMLWSRLIKDAVKAMTGDGVDTSGDPDLDDDVRPVGGDGGAIDVPFEVKSEAKPEPKVATNGNDNGQHADKPVETPVNDPQPVASQTPLAADSGDKGETCLCTPDQVTTIAAAMNELGMSSEKRGAALAKRGVNTIPALSYAQAVEMLGNLRAAIDKRRQTALDTANGKTGQAASKPDDGTLCSEVQEQAARSLLVGIEQTSPNFTKDFVRRFKATGRELLKEMTAVECDALIESLKTKNLESFFENSLRPKVKSEAAASEGNSGN